MARPSRKTQKIATDVKTAPVPGVAALVVLQGAPADIGVHKVLDRPIVVGRGLEVDLALLDEGLSRKHCVVRPDGDGAIVEDLGSTNGTRVNGKRIAAPTKLRHGDLIFISDSVLKFSAGALELRYHASMDERIGTDELTGLLARHRFEGALAQAIDACVQSQPPGVLGVMMLDLDGIKQINDTHGHLFGAHTIAEAGRLIGEQVARVGLASRLGGDEFAAFLPRQNKAQTATAAEEILLRVRGHRFIKDGIVLKPSISIGVAAFPEDGRTGTELMARADEALYRAKQAGKNRVSL